MLQEPKKKLTLEQLRTLYPFDIAVLASLAEVEPKIVYFALLRQPIYREQAVNVLNALSRHTGVPLTFAHIDLVLWEEYLCLWIIRATTTEQPEENNSETQDEYYFVYARDKEHATTLATPWFKQVHHLPFHTFTLCQHGLRIGQCIISGYQQAPEKADEESGRHEFITKRMEGMQQDREEL